MSQYAEIVRVSQVCRKLSPFSLFKQAERRGVTRPAASRNQDAAGAKVTARRAAVEPRLPHRRAPRAGREREREHRAGGDEEGEVGFENEHAVSDRILIETALKREEYWSRTRGSHYEANVIPLLDT